MASGTEIPMLITGQQRDLWTSNGHGLTVYLGYAQPGVALTKIVKFCNTKAFAELPPHVPVYKKTLVDDPRAKYVNEPGYRLIARSTTDKAEIFQDWVYEVVLASIREIGSYAGKHQEDRVLQHRDSCSC